jgi:hypothetical protein
MLSLFVQNVKSSELEEVDIALFVINVLIDTIIIVHG